MRRSCHALCFASCMLVYPLLVCAQLPGTNTFSATGTVFADGGSARLQDVAVRLCDSRGRTILQSSSSSSVPATAIVYPLLANMHMKQQNYPVLLEDIDAYVRLDSDSPAGLRAKEIRVQIQKQMQEEAASR